MSLIFFGRDFRIGTETLDDGSVLETIAVDDFVKFNCENRTSVVFKVQCTQYFKFKLAFRMYLFNLTDLSLGSEPN